MESKPSFSSAEPLYVRIGTRASPLARVQAEMVARYLKTHLPNHKIETFPMSTKGDQLTQQKLVDIGGKGLFTGEIDQAIAQNQVDIGVHSLKDMPIDLSMGQDILAIPCREDPREGFLSLSAKTLQDLPQGATLGTASIRREAQARALRPDLKIVPFRGNVGTRLKKLESGEADATFLAMAGLTRLAQADLAQPIPLAEMCPAPCQGLIAVCGIRENLSGDILEALSKFDNASARISAVIERAFLAGLDGSCRTPIAAHAAIVECENGKQNTGEFTERGVGEFVGEVYGETPAQLWRAKAPFSPNLSLAELADFGHSQAAQIREMAGETLPQFQATSWR